MFESCAFGPWALRRILRDAPGERDHVLAWGVVTERRGGLPEVWSIVVALIPGIGPVVGAMLGGSGRPSVLLVTRTRLVVLDGKRKPGAKGWVRWEAELGSAEIRKEGWTFVVRDGEGGGLVRLRPACGEEGVDRVLKALASGS